MLQSSEDREEAARGADAGPTARPDYRLGGTSGNGWKPGQSGNPNGRRGERKYKGMTLPQLARKHTGDALRTLAHIVNDPKELTPNRIAAANVILQRGWGDVPRDPSAGETIRFIIETVDTQGGPEHVPGVLNTPLRRTCEDDPNTADTPERAPPPRPRFIGYDAHVLNHDGPAERGVGWVPPEAREAAG